MKTIKDRPNVGNYTIIPYMDPSPIMGIAGNQLKQYFLEWDALQKKGM